MTIYARHTFNVIQWDANKCLPNGEVPEDRTGLDAFVAEVAEALSNQAVILATLPLSDPGRAVILYATRDDTGTVEIPDAI